MSKQFAQAKPIYDATGWLGRNTVGRAATAALTGFNVATGQVDIRDAIAELNEKRKNAKTPGVIRSIADIDYGDGKSQLKTHDEFTEKLKQRDKTRQDKIENEKRRIEDLIYSAAERRVSNGRGRAGDEKIVKDYEEKYGIREKEREVVDAKQKSSLLGILSRNNTGKGGIGAVVKPGIGENQSAEAPAKKQEDVSSAQGFANFQPGGQTKTATTPATPNAAGTITTASSGAMPLGVNPEIEKMLNGAAGRHLSAQHSNQVETHNTTVVNTMQQSGVAEAITASAAAAHADHLESLRKLRETNASGAEHNQRVDAANAALKNVEDRESAGIAKMNERLGNLQGQLGSSNTPHVVGSAPQAGQAQDRARIEGEIRVLQQNIQRVQTVQTDRRAVQALAINNAAPKK